MTQKILAFLDDQHINMIQQLFPKYEVKKIGTVQELYLESIEGFSLFFFDHKNKVAKKIAGIDKFINSFNGHNSFGLQLLPNANLLEPPENASHYELHFLQYIPLRRFTMNDFLAKKPWEQQELNSPQRKHIRLSLPVPIEVIRSNLYTVSLKTYAEDVSIKGMKILADLAPGEVVKIKSPLIPELMVEGVVKWSIPWGKLGQIAYGGVEFQHDAKSMSFKMLAKFMKEVFIPRLEVSGGLN